MEKVNFTIKTEDCTMENGNAIKCTDTELYIINLGKLHMKETGMTINFKESVSFITKIRKNLMNLSTLIISTLSMSTGSTLMVKLCLFRLIRIGFEAWERKTNVKQWIIFDRKIRS
jgi:hypothetical protein